LDCKKVIRLSARTGEVQVGAFILVRFNGKTGGSRPARRPTFCPSQQKVGKKWLSPGGGHYCRSGSVVHVTMVQIIPPVLRGEEAFAGLTPALSRYLFFPNQQRRCLQQPRSHLNDPPRLASGADEDAAFLQLLRRW